MFIRGRETREQNCTQSLRSVTSHHQAWWALRVARRPGDGAHSTDDTEVRRIFALDLAQGGSEPNGERERCVSHEDLCIWFSRSSTRVSTFESVSQLRQNPKPDGTTTSLCQKNWLPRSKKCSQTCSTVLVARVWLEQTNSSIMFDGWNSSTFFWLERQESTTSSCCVNFSVFKNTHIDRVYVCVFIGVSVHAWWVSELYCVI